MKQYLETESGFSSQEDGFFPAAAGNTQYNKMRAEVAAGRAEITPFDSEAEALKSAAVEERQWRNGELQRADIEVFKAEDVAGAFNAEDWRAYRQALRVWPNSPDFPDPSKRPTAPA